MHTTCSELHRETRREHDLQAVSNRELVSEDRTKSSTRRPRNCS